MPSPAAQTPAQWLIAEYEAADLAGIYLSDELDETLRPAGGHVDIQPMIALKDDTYPGCPMRVTPADYQHPDGRLL